MMSKMSFILSEAKRKLTRLGLSLFYFYLFLTGLGLIGFVFGIITLLQKSFIVDSLTGTSWWEAMALICVSSLMMKIFLREAFNLLDIDNTNKLQKTEYVDGVEEEKPLQSNVIPFDRTPRW
jgi:membrane-bound ClpP family serine protease